MSHKILSFSHHFSLLAVAPGSITCHCLGDSGTFHCLHLNHIFHLCRTCAYPSFHHGGDRRFRTDLVDPLLHGVQVATKGWLLNSDQAAPMPEKRVCKITSHWSAFSDFLLLLTQTICCMNQSLLFFCLLVCFDFFF